MLWFAGGEAGQQRFPRARDPSEQDFPRARNLSQQPFPRVRDLSEHGPTPLLKPLTRVI